MYNNGSTTYTPTQPNHFELGTVLPLPTMTEH